MSLLTTKRRRKPPADMLLVWLGAGMVLGSVVTLIVAWAIR